MDKLDKLIEQARNATRYDIGIHYSNATREELIEIINENTSDQRIHEIIAVIENRVRSEV